MSQTSYKLPTINTRKANDADLEDDSNFRPLVGSIEKKPYRVFEHTAIQQHIHFYLSQEIGAPDQYIEMIHRISIAQPQDVVYIHLNTTGGHLDTGVQIVNAMQTTQAHVVTILESTAYSLGTLIFLAGDEMVVNDHCLMMFHNFKGGFIGKGNEVVSELAATIDWFQTLARDVYIPFLSEEEFERIVRGEDMWMQTPEIRKRLDIMMEVLQSEDAPIDQADDQIDDQAFST